MSEKKFIIKFYSCDNEEQFLKDIYHNLNVLEQENQKLKEQLQKINKEPCTKYYDGLRDGLCIDKYLELIREDRVCRSAFVSFGQYMSILEENNKYLSGQLQQRDSVIKEAIRYIGSSTFYEATHWDDEYDYDSHRFNDDSTNVQKQLLDILTKYKNV